MLCRGLLVCGTHAYVHGTFVRYDDRYDGTVIVVQLCNDYNKNY